MPKRKAPSVEDDAGESEMRKRRAHVIHPKIDPESLENAMKFLVEVVSSPKHRKEQCKDVCLESFEERAREILSTAKPCLVSRLLNCERNSKTAKEIWDGLIGWHVTGCSAMRKLMFPSLESEYQKLAEKRKTELQIETKRKQELPSGKERKAAPAPLLLREIKIEKSSSLRNRMETQQSGSYLHKFSGEPASTEHLVRSINNRKTMSGPRNEEMDGGDDDVQFLCVVRKEHDVRSCDFFEKGQQDGVEMKRQDGAELKKQDGAGMKKQNGTEIKGQDGVGKRLLGGHVTVGNGSSKGNSPSEDNPEVEIICAVEKDCKHKLRSSGSVQIEATPKIAIEFQQRYRRSGPKKLPEKESLTTTPVKNKRSLKQVNGLKKLSFDDATARTVRRSAGKERSAPAEADRSEIRKLRSQLIRCSFCTGLRVERYGTYEDLKEHIKLTHGFTCGICRIIFKDSMDAFLHWTTAHVHGCQLKERKETGLTQNSISPKNASRAFAALNLYGSTSQKFPSSSGDLPSLRRSKSLPNLSVMGLSGPFESSCLPRMLDPQKAKNKDDEGQKVCGDVSDLVDVFGPVIREMSQEESEESANVGLMPVMIFPFQLNLDLVHPDDQEPSRRNPQPDYKQGEKEEIGNLVDGVLQFYDEQPDRVRKSFYDHLDMVLQKHRIAKM